MALPLSAIVRGLTPLAIGRERGLREAEERRKQAELDAMEKLLTQGKLEDLSFQRTKRQREEEERRQRTAQVAALREQFPELKNLPESELSKVVTSRLETRRQGPNTVFTDRGLLQYDPETGDFKPAKVAGVQGPVGRPTTPTDPEKTTGAQDSAAAFGLSMAQSHLGMRDIEERNPRAIQEVARFTRGSRILGSLPVVGPALDEAIRAGRAPALSPEARQLMAHLNSFVAASAPERGGKQLTLAEMKMILDEMLVDPGDDPGTQAVKLQNRLKRIQEARLKGGEAAWQRAQELGGFTNEQIFGTRPTPATPAAAPTRSSLHPEGAPQRRIDDLERKYGIRTP